MQLQGSLIRNVIFSVLLLLLPILIESSNSHLISFMGRTHPILIHFPIVLIYLTAGLEWWQGHSQNHHIQRMLSVLFGLSLYAATLSTLAGFLLSRTGVYEGSYLNWHQWTGVIVTLAIAWSTFFRRYFHHTKKWRWRQAYRLLIFASVFLVTYTGHLGGSITHGADFLTSPLKEMTTARQLKNTPAIKSPASMQIYGDVIQPILKKKCLKCHNDANQKGGLNLTSIEQIIAGGKSEKPGVVPGNPEQSELLVRVNLDEDHPDFMPPDGKTPLDADELALLTWWIQSGASATDSVGSGPNDSTTARSLANYLPKLANVQLARKRAQEERKRLSPKLVRLGVKQGLQILSDPDTDSSYYAVSMQIPPRHVSDEHLAELMDYADVFSKISLVAADITDESLYYLGQMPNLRKVILTKSCITGSGLVHLAELPELEMLNLSHTDIDDIHVLAITSFPKLREVYLFNTFVSPEMVATLDAYLPNVKVCLEEGPYY